MTTAEIIYRLVQTLPDEDVSQVLTFVESLCQRIQTESQEKAQPLSAYFGILKNSPNFNADPVNIQQDMRSEWD